jgi:hypothetical protein
MYRTRLKTWKVFKNLKSSQKTLLLLRHVENQRKSPTSSEAYFNDKDQRRLGRHIKAMTRTQDQCPNQEGDLDAGKLLLGWCRNSDSEASGDRLGPRETPGAATDAAAPIATTALGQKHNVASQSEYRPARICICEFTNTHFASIAKFIISHRA